MMSKFRLMISSRRSLNRAFPSLPPPYDGGGEEFTPFKFTFLPTRSIG